jgi:hypothetical protein
MFHTGHIEVRCVLDQLAELVSSLASVHQVVEATGVFSKGAYIELGLLLYLILDVAHEVTYGGAASTLE